MIATIVVSFFIIACFHTKSNLETFVHFIKLDHEHFILNSKELMRYYTSGTARVIYAVSIGVSTVDRPYYKCEPFSSVGINCESVV